MSFLQREACSAHFTCGLSRCVHSETCRWYTDYFLIFNLAKLVFKLDLSKYIYIVHQRYIQEQILNQSVCTDFLPLIFSQTFPLCRTLICPLPACYKMFMKCCFPVQRVEKVSVFSMKRPLTLVCEGGLSCDHVTSVWMRCTLFYFYPISFPTTQPLIGYYLRRLKGNVSIFEPGLCFYVCWCWNDS